MPSLLVDARQLRRGATGVGSYAAQLLCALDRVAPAHGVRLLALRLAGSEHEAWAQLSHTQVLVTPVDYESHPRGDLFLQWGLPRLAARVGADTLLSPGFLAPVVAARGRARVRRVLMVHDLLMDDPVVTMPAGFRQYLRAMVRLGLPRCECVATSSAVTRAALAARSGVPTLFIPPGVDHALFRPAPRTPRLPDGTPRTHPVVLYTASFEPRKNHALLLAAVQSLPCQLVLLNGGAWPGPPLPAGVRVVAPCNAREVAAWTAAADVVVFPSLVEGFGIPMLEAMACGTPLLAADMPAARWLSGGGRAAQLLPPGDVSAWSQALQHAVRHALHGDDPEWAARVAAGVRRAAGFQWDRSAQRLLRALYGEVGMDPKPGSGACAG
jgi:glycosyltransferase involved in cell wall biosynthesis